MKNDINLEEFLSRPSVDLQEMLQVPNILGDIKSSFPRFVTYLQTRKAAIFQLIDLVTTTSQEQLETDEGLKRYPQPNSASASAPIKSCQTTMIA
jgi:hypothetical protein